MAGRDAVVVVNGALLLLLLLVSVCVSSGELEGGRGIGSQIHSAIRPPSVRPHPPQSTLCHLLLLGVAGPLEGAVVVAATPWMPSYVNVPGGDRHHDMEV